MNSGKDCGPKWSANVLMNGNSIVARPRAAANADHPGIGFSGISIVGCHPAKYKHRFINLPPFMKNLRALYLLFSANTVSGFSSGITFLAIPWYLVSTLGSENGKLINAEIMVTITTIAIFWGTYAGTLIDRYNRKRIFQVMNLTDTVLLGLAALYGATTGEMPVLLLAGMAAATIFTYNIHYPNLYAFVQELFEPQYYQKVNSAIELQGQVTNFLGMLTGGFLLAGSASIPWWPEALAFTGWEMWEIFLLDACTYLASFFLISLIPYKPGAYMELSEGSLWKRTKEGFDYLRSDIPLLIFGMASHTIFFNTARVPPGGHGHLCQ